MLNQAPGMSPAVRETSSFRSLIPGGLGAGTSAIRDGAQSYRSFGPGDRNLDAILQEAEVASERRRRRLQFDPRYNERLVEAAEFVDKVFRGRAPAELFAEAMSTSDFPILFGDILDRQLLGQFESWPLTWPQYAHRSDVRDFRMVRRITNDGLNERWYPNYLVPEMSAVPEVDNLQEGQYTYSVQVYEKSFSINWRMLINDDLNAFNNLAPRLADGAHKSEEYFVTSLYTGATGPNATFYSNAHKNIVNQTNGALANNPPLSIAGLQDAMTVILSQVNPVTGEPIYIDMLELVVPPALEVIAQNILNGTQLWVGGDGQAEGGGTAGQRIITNNWMARKVHLNVNPYIPMIASSSHGNTSWFLFANPNSNRPALEIGFLRGYEAPQLFQKLPNTMRLGGGVDPIMGDFDTMEITYKGLHIFGGTTMSEQMSVASNGSGS